MRNQEHQKALDRRTGMAQSKFAEMKIVLCNYHLALKVRMKFFNTNIRSRLCYCCETWTLTAKQFKRLETVHTQFLRRLVRRGMARLSSRKEIEQIQRSMKAGNTTQENGINWAWKHSNDKVRTMSKTDTLQSYIESKMYDCLHMLYEHQMRHLQNG